MAGSAVLLGIGIWLGGSTLRTELRAEAPVAADDDHADLTAI